MLTEIIMMASALTFQQLAAQSDGLVGICTQSIASAEPTCVNGDQKFPLQSVMKLVVSAAVMDLVDRQRLRLTDMIVVLPKDASPGPQEFADLVRAKGGLSVTVEELIRRAIVDSDSTSVDVLLEKIGGVAVVRDFLKRKKVEGITIDRDERHLQADSVGLAWQPEYADSVKFEAAVSALPVEKRDAAWDFYLKDARDTATPLGMVGFLKALAVGLLISESSTKKLMTIMKATTTGQDRLMSGTPMGWRLGHKTGTGRTWKGMVSATNDVGILIAPDGGQIAVAVFIAGSTRSSSERAAIIAHVAKLAASAYQPRK